MECIVFYESWQLECCGQGFSNGDRIRWLVCQAQAADSSAGMGKVDYFYEAHTSHWEELWVLEGKVERIQILYQRYQKVENSLYLLVPVGGELIETDCARGFDKELGDLKPSGYRVALSECTIRPAKREEVNFP